MVEPGFLKHKTMLKTIFNAKDNRGREILHQVGNDVIKSISEVALNVMKGIIPVSPREKDILRSWKSQLKTLSNKSSSIKKKRQVLMDNTKLTRMLIKFVLDLKD